MRNMPHLSKNRLDKHVYFDILNGLYWLLSDIKTSKEMQIFLGDFFTKTERLMLSKRLATVLMIAEGYDVEIIKRVLKVSTATIYRMREWVEKEGRGLQDGLRRLARRKAMEQFWTDVDKFISRDFPTTRNILRRAKNF
jgi:uncharacterized protein YerC